IRITGLVAKFKPSGRAISSTGKAYKFDRSVVEIIMNPIRMAVEILDHVERSSQDNQRHDFSRALVRIGLLDVAAEHPLRICEQAIKQIIELRVADQFTAQIVKVEKDSSIAILHILCHVLVERVQALAVKIACGKVGNWAK